MGSPAAVNAGTRLTLELATDCYRIYDAVMLRLARGRENMQDLLAEARALARGKLGRGKLQAVGA